MHVPSAEDSMNIKLVCLEDGIMSCGFRKIVSYVERLNEDTSSYFVSTDNYRSLLAAARGRTGGGGSLDPDAIDEIARGLADADLVGFSSMTGYADLTKAVIHRLRALSPGTYIIWGGIHPIIHPEDAIEAEIDAICVGEGEFAFQELFDKLSSGGEFRQTRNFWFKDESGITRNPFRPLMTTDEMETLPFPKYGDEWIYKKGRGFVPIRLKDYLTANGLSYNAIWSIGCPLHCTFCGNTKFIANDPKYRKIRHPSAEYIVQEVKAAREKFPHISTVCFHDDSFMAIPLEEIEAFATLWREEVGIPFAVYGVIPNYVRREKYDVLTWAGMNRIRMGIQSGSQQILEFYKRPTKIEEVEKAADVSASFSPRYHIPPAYDIIMDNPVETKADVLATLELLYRLRRPYTLNFYSLKVIPNTELERVMRELGVDLEKISANYATVPPRWANVLVYLLALWRPPRWLFDRLLRRVEASAAPQRLHPVLSTLVRTLALTKRAADHLRFMDFSTIPGYTGYVFWRLGVVEFWWKRLSPRPPRPPSEKRGSRESESPPRPARRLTG
jgi:radical SAM superfamily enzyme YgiQ (UPF0313 family)